MRIVGGRWGGRPIAAPPGRGTRPTTDRVREAWMSALAGEIPGARVVDLFAGSGALGLEALSRGAVHATFVENSPSALRVLKRNIDRLEAAEQSVTVVRNDVFRFLEPPSAERFDIAFADPPYASGHAQRLADSFQRRPFARLLCIEHGRTDELTGFDPIWQRRYGDSVLTFIVAGDGD